MARETIADLEAVQYAVAHTLPSDGELAYIASAQAELAAEGIVTPGPLVDLPLAWLLDDPANERADVRADPRYAELAASVAAHGVLEPLQAFWIAAHRYMLKSGHRRRAAAEDAGLGTVPVILCPPPADEVQQAVHRLAANIHADLDPIRRAATYQILLDAGRMTQEELARQVGCHQATISRRLALLRLPRVVQDAIASGELSAEHGTELLRITQPERQWYSGKLTGKSAADVQTRYAADAVRDAGSVATLRLRVDAYIRDEAQAVRNAERRQAELARDRAAALEREGSLPVDLTPEEIAAAQAERERKEAEAAKQQATKGREELRLQRRELVADGVIGTVVGHWNPHGAPNLELLRVAAVAALEGARQTTYSYLSPIPQEERTALLAEIDAVADLPTLLNVLGRIGRAALRLDPDRRALGGNWEIKQWADKRWGLNVQIADALLAAKLIQANSYATLVNGKPQPPEPGP